MSHAKKARPLGIADGCHTDEVANGAVQNLTNGKNASCKVDVTLLADATLLANLALICHEKLSRAIFASKEITRRIFHPSFHHESFTNQQTFAEIRLLSNQPITNTTPTIIFFIFALSNHNVLSQPQPDR